MYEATIEPSIIARVEAEIRAVAARWDLSVYEKDRQEMKAITDGQDAFAIFLYFAGDPILSLTNAGVGDVLVLMAFDHGKMPIHELERLTADVLETLAARLALEFKESPEGS